jgi:phage terminase small subunit
MLTPKQKRFVDEYLTNLNGTQAAIRAGYSPNSAHVIASENLRKPQIASAIEAAMNGRAENAKLNAGRVVEMIVDTIERCRQAVPVLDREGNPIGEYRFDASNVLKGCELLGRHLGMFTDKTEVSGPGGAAIPVINVTIG